MSTQTALQYIVHLDIPATALDPSDAVHEALDQVRRGGAGNFAYSVEEVGRRRKFLSAPVPRVGSVGAIDHLWVGRRRTADNRFHGEFLG